MIKNAAHYYFPVLNTITDGSHGEFGDQVSGTERNPLKGYNYHNETKPYTGGIYMKETDKKERSKPIVRFWMDRILNLCQKNDINVLLLGFRLRSIGAMLVITEVNEYALEKGVPYLILT